MTVVEKEALLSFVLVFR